MCLPGRPEVGYTWKGWVSCYWSYGGQYFKPGTFEPDFNSDAGLKAAKIWYAAAKEKLMPPDVPAWAFLEVMAAQQSGEVAWTFNWQLIYPTLENPDESPLVYDKMAHDDPPGAVQPDGTILKAPYRGGNVVGLRKTSQHKKEAFKYLAWHMWGDGMWSAVEQGSTPGNLVPYNDPESVAKYPWIADFARMNLHIEGRPEPAYPELPTIQAQGCAAVNSLLSLQITPEDFVERIQNEAVTVLKEAGRI
jgi:multiple sugar transport system substrate-binding protein